MRIRKNAQRIVQMGRTWVQDKAKSCALCLCCFYPSLCITLGRWRYVAFRFDPKSLELQTGAMALNVGLWLALASIRQGQSKALLGGLGAHLWPAPFWAVAFAAVGLMQIIASGYAHIRIRIRCRCAMCGFCLWAFLFVLAIMGEVPGLGVALFP